MNNTHSILLVVIISVVTMVLRFIPMWVFGNGQQTPKLIQYMGKVLPYAIMGMLVVFCLKDVSLIRPPYGILELIACMIVVGLHVWKRNTALSIVGGTVVYMILVQGLF
jgi:branched-subunit amino acid transport protein AzlD